MNFLLRRLLVLFIGLGVAAGLIAQQPGAMALPKVLVFDLQAASGVADDEAAIYGELVRNQLRFLEDWQVVSRRDQLLAAARTANRLADQEDEYRLASQLKADFVIRGSVSRSAGTWRVRISLSHAETWMTLSEAWHEAESFQSLMVLAGPLVKRLQEFMSRPAELPSWFDDADSGAYYDSATWSANEPVSEYQEYDSNEVYGDTEYYGLNPDDKVALLSYSQDQPHGRTQAIWQGLVQASADYDFELHWRQSVADNEVLSHVGLLRDDGYRLFFLAESGYGPAVYEALEAYPDCFFVMFDDLPLQNGVRPEMAPFNSSFILITEHHPGFLGGVAAALALGSAEVAFMAASNTEPFQFYLNGFRQGLRYANTEFGTNVTLDRDDAFMDIESESPGRAGEIATKLFENGISLIVAAAGKADSEIVAASVAARSAGLPIWLLGTDFARSALDEAGRELYLTTAVKDYARAADTIAYNALQGSGPFGMVLLWEGTFGGADLTPLAVELSPEDLTRLENVKADVLSGNIYVERFDGTE